MAFRCSGSYFRPDDQHTCLYGLLLHKQGSAAFPTFSIMRPTCAVSKGCNKEAIPMPGCSKWSAISHVAMQRVTLSSPTKQGTSYCAAKHALNQSMQHTGQRQHYSLVLLPNCLLMLLELLVMVLPVPSQLCVTSWLLLLLVNCRCHHHWAASSVTANSAPTSRALTMCA